jgi:hypothetical protein
MNLAPTDLNRRIAEAVQYSVSSDRFYLAGKTAFWRFVGLGLIGFAIGGSIGLGLYGYSAVRSSRTNQTELAAAISKSLAGLELQGSTEGTVTVDPSELMLAPDQTVSLASNSMLALDPNARIRADGEIVVQGPSVSSPASANNRVPEISNFTVFKRMPFQKGTVMTGWKFLTSAQRKPSSQYCYYSASSDETPGRNIALDIATDEHLDPPKTLPEGFDLQAAFRMCVWFRS